MFTTDPLTENCRQALHRGEHVCIGVSPFNRYFSTGRIAQLAEWGMKSFEHYHFFIPDRAAAFTLEALGYEPARARHKAQRQGNYVRNKIVRALEGLGVADGGRLVLDGEALEGNAAYQRLLGEARQRVAGDPGFGAACLDAAGWVLENKLPDGGQPTAEQLRTAVRYFVAELPMFISTVDIVASTSSVFVYHQRVRVLERLYHGELDWNPHPGQGFVVVRPDDE